MAVSTKPPICRMSVLQLSVNLGVFELDRLSRVVAAFILLTLPFFSSYLYGANKDRVNLQKIDDDKEDKNKPPQMGNYALRSSQQPTALLGFGQNIIDKDQTQFFLFTDDYIGVKKHFVDIAPSILYGINEKFSVLFNAPFAASYKQDCDRSLGWEDVFLQFEYAFRTKTTAEYTSQATIIANATFPTGSTHKQPSTGFGSMSYFGGLTWNRTYVDWFVYTSHGILVPTFHHRTKFGNGLFYQFGIGRNILSINSKFIFDWLLEINGQYNGKNRFYGIIDQDSGGNIVYITPSLWFSTEKLILQLGVGFPVTQHLYGNQKRNISLIAGNIVWTFF